MQNFAKLGDTLTLPAPYPVVSGQGAQVGTIFGVAQASYAQGQNGEFLRKGVVTLPKGNVAIALGAQLYWDNTNRVATTTATNNKLIGAA